MMSAARLRVTTPTDCEISMSRVFDAPRSLVFEALTKPELVKRWLTGPPGWSMTVCEIDLKVGGSYRFVWTGTDGTVMGIRGVYREILPPERFVNTEVFDQPWSFAPVLASRLFAKNNVIFAPGESCHVHSTAIGDKRWYIRHYN